MMFWHFYPNCSQIRQNCTENDPFTISFDEFYIISMKIKFKGLSINSDIEKLKKLKSWKSSLFLILSYSLSVLELWKDTTRNSDHSMRSPEVKIYILFLLLSPNVLLFLYCLIYLSQWHSKWHILHLSIRVKINMITNGIWPLLTNAKCVILNVTDSFINKWL